MGTIFWILWIALAAWALYTIWTGGDDNTKKIIWSLVVVFLGPLGFLIWYLVGRS